MLAAVLCCTVLYCAVLCCAAADRERRAIGTGKNERERESDNTEEDSHVGLHSLLLCLSCPHCPLAATHCIAHVMYNTKSEG
jgi:hypothetical protein